MKDRFLRTLNVGLGNNKTTIAGLGLGSAYYLQGSGLQLPHNQADWINFAISLLLAIFGLLAKDATTGSEPSGPVK